MESRIEKAKEKHRSGYNCSPAGGNQRAAVYKAARTIIQEFKNKNQSVICKELKGIETGKVLRDCRGCVEDAAALLEKVVFQTEK